jgi:hypothetical protein
MGVGGGYSVALSAGFKFLVSCIVIIYFLFCVVFRRLRNLGGSSVRLVTAYTGGVIK